MPERIQRRRTKGWRMPEGAVYVGRPSRWGNPYVVYAEEILHHINDCGEWWCPRGAAREAVEMYRLDLMDGRLDISIGQVRALLRGRDLACWCALGQPCHADVLLEVANQ